MSGALAPSKPLTAADVCDRCVKLGGDHEASQLRNLSVGEHRALFRRFVAGSSDAAAGAVKVGGRALQHRHRRDKPGEHGN